MATDETRLLKGLHLEQDGVTLVTPCTYCTFYFRYAPYDGVRDLVEQSRAALGEHLSHLSWGQRFIRISSRTEARIQKILTRPSLKGNASHQFWMRSHGQDQGCSAASLSVDFFPAEDWVKTEEDRVLRRQRLLHLWGDGITMMGGPVSEITATFPLDHPLAEPAELRDWLFNLHCVREASCVGGHAGYALNTFSESASSSYTDAIYAQLRQALLNHPGLDYPETGHILNGLLRYVPGNDSCTMVMRRVQWLNFLAGETLTLCGGRDRLRTAIDTSEHLSCTAFGNGLCIQAGDRPLIGNVRRGDLLPAYREAARLLQPARAQMRPETDSPLLKTWFDALDWPEEPITPEDFAARVQYHVL